MQIHLGSNPLPFGGGRKCYMYVLYVDLFVKLFCQFISGISKCYMYVNRIFKFREKV